MRDNWHADMIVGIIIMIISVISTTLIIIPIIAETQVEGQLQYTLYLIPIIMNITTVAAGAGIFLRHD